MEESLISKKDLLQLTGISYGQLYRWKRKNLIPEEWFIRKSTFTGQETYFPKEKILERIKKIMDMKEDLSLDDLAETFSYRPTEINIQRDILIKGNIVTQNIVTFYETIYGQVEHFTFEMILFMSIAEKFLLSGEVSFEEAKGIINNLQENYKKFQGRGCEIVFIRKFGIGVSLLMTTSTEFYLEEGSKLVLKVNIASFIEELKIKLSSVDVNLSVQ